MLTVSPPKNVENTIRPIVMERTTRDTLRPKRLSEILPPSVSLFIEIKASEKRVCKKEGIKTG